MRNNGHPLPRRADTLAAVMTGALLVGTLLPAAGAETSRDLLRFLNGDSLHGQFLGMPDGGLLTWKHADAREPIVLETERLRHLALNGGRSQNNLRNTSFVRLHDGDLIPGDILALDGEKLTIETEMAGTLDIPRSSIRQIAPNPHGGGVHYVGPFSADDWSVIEPPLNEDDDKEAGQEEADDPEAADIPAPPEEGPWVFSGAAYYSNSQLPIVVDAHTPDKARIRFTLAWRNRLNAVIAFHATMTGPKQPEPAVVEGEDATKEDGKEPPPAAVERRRVLMRDAGGTLVYAQTYGESYVLTIYPNYAQLFRCSFTSDGEPEVERLSTSGASLRLDEAGDTEFELRCDRSENSIALFADGEFVSQWEDSKGYAGLGGHLAFACQNTASRLRVSDVVVSSWNGLLDSARSMEVEDRDIVLLSNGTDRFSGQVTGLAGGVFEIQGTYNGMRIPLDAVQEIRLGGHAESEPTKESLRILLQPFGRLTVTPLEASAEHLKARHPSLGDLTIDLRYAGLFEFSFTESVLDSWDDDF